MTLLRHRTTFLVFALCATAGVAALIAHAASGNVRAVLELVGVLSAAILVVWMIGHQVGPLDLLIRLLIWKQAVLLGVREELSAAWSSLIESHGERMQRVRARHVGGVE